MTPHHVKKFQLPANLLTVRDIKLQASVCGITALLACTGNCLALASTGQVVAEISLSAPCHSCAWANGSGLEAYAGILSLACLVTAA